MYVDLYKDNEWHTPYFIQTWEIVIEKLLQNTPIQA